MRRRGTRSKRLADKAQIPVVESGAMKGQFSDASPLSANAAPGALASADLVILVGQHCMPTVGEFAFGPDAQVHPHRSGARKTSAGTCPSTSGIVSCERAALEALADAMPRHEARRLDRRDRRGAQEVRRSELLAYYRIGFSYTDAVHPAVIAHELARLSLSTASCRRSRRPSRRAATAWRATCGASCAAYRPGQIMNGAYQYGAIGPDVGYARRRSGWPCSSASACRRPTRDTRSSARRAMAASATRSWRSRPWPSTGCPL